MNTQGKVMMVAVTLAACGYAAVEYFGQHPPSAPLPAWISGEFGASAARYAGRTVAVDSVAIRFAHGDGTSDVLPIEWIEETTDARPYVRTLDLHVKDGEMQSTIRLIASSQDSSFRLQTMPDVAWRRLSDREAREVRTAARRLSTAGAANVVARVETSRGPVQPTDTTIGAVRFTDRDPVAQDELSQVVKACRIHGCRIGIRGLHPNQYQEFSHYLKGLGADSVSLTTEVMANATLAMMEISSRREPAQH